MHQDLTNEPRIQIDQNAADPAATLINQIEEIIEVVSPK